jgi:hypothetical protein
MRAGGRTRKAPAHGASSAAEIRRAPEAYRVQPSAQKANDSRLSARRAYTLGDVGAIRANGAFSLVLGENGLCQQLKKLC